VSSLRSLRLARNVALVCAIRLLFWTHFISAILVPVFRDWGGIGLDRILLLNAWFMLWGCALEVPTGAVADRFGRKVSAVLGCAFGALAVLVYVSAPRFEVFLAAEVVMALSYALVSGAEDALLYESLAALGRSGEVQRVAARAESLKLTGIVLGALGGAWLSSVVGLRGTLALQALPMGAAALLGLALLEPPHSGERERRSLTWLQIAREGLGHLRRTPALRALSLDVVSVNGLAFLMIWLYQPLLKAAGIGQRWFGVVHVGLCLGQIALLQGSARIESALGSRRALLTAFAQGVGGRAARHRRTESRPRPRVRACRCPRARGLRAPAHATRVSCANSTRQSRLPLRPLSGAPPRESAAPRATCARRPAARRAAA